MSRQELQPAEAQFVLSRDEEAVYNSKTVEGIIFRFIVHCEQTHSFEADSIAQLAAEATSQLAGLEEQYTISISLDALARGQVDTGALQQLAKGVIETRDSAKQLTQASSAAQDISQVNYPDLRKANGAVVAEK